VRICVSGAAGFIGSHVVDRLFAAGHTVIAIDNLSTGRAENLSHLKGRPGLRIILGDLEEVRMQAVGGIDAFIHCAALSSVNACQKDPEDAWYQNVEVTRDALALAKTCKAGRFVFVSTGAIYGTEERDEPQSVYAKTKLAAEIAVELEQHTKSGSHPMQPYVLRLGNVFGPRQRADLECGVIAKWMRALKDGAADLGVTGDGEQTRDFIYVGEVVQRIVECATGTDAWAWFDVWFDVVASGVSRSIDEMAGRVWAAAGRPGQVVIRHLPLPPGEVRFTDLPVEPLDVDRLGVRLDEWLKATWESVR
jgi:UDP-glucose 4-epimerase